MYVAGKSKKGCDNMFTNIATKTTGKLEPAKKLFDKEEIIFMDEAKH